MRRGHTLLLAVVILASAAPLWAQATDADDLKTTVEALKARIKDQDRRIAELESSQSGSTAEARRAAQRQIIKEVLAELQADADKHPSTLPSWLEGLKFSGDFRLRYQGDFYDWGPTDDADRKDRNRARYRLRIGLVKAWLDKQLEVGFRLASGSNNDPTSTNETFSGNYSTKPVWIDLAYAKYSPKAVKGLSITGGKMKNPWLMNEIFMDSDVNPEGFWVAYKAPQFGPVKPFAGAGYFILRESSGGFDTIMYGGQAGMTWDIAKDVAYTFGAYWQDYDHYDTSGANPRGNDNPVTLVPAFGVVGLTNAVQFRVLGQPVKVSLDWAHNCAEQDPTAEYEDDHDAFYAGVKVGKNKKAGDWSAKYSFGYVEANALPGHFVDSDFGHGNRMGHVIGGQYNILDYLTVGVNVLFVEPIFSPTTNANSSALEDQTVTVQADLIWKF